MMSFLSYSGVPNKLIHVFGLTLLSLAYFNSCIIAEPVSVFIQISFLVGQTLVNRFLLICNSTVEVAKLGYSFFQIVYEDSVIFVKDATEKFTIAIFLLKSCYLFLESGVQLAFAHGWHLLELVFEILKTVSSIVDFWNYIFVFIKQTLHIFGSSVWFFVTLAPEAVVCSYNSIHNFINNSANGVLNTFYVLMNKISQSIEKIYQSCTEIPIDSVCGLIIGLIFIAVLYIKFKDLAFFLLNIFLKLYHCAVSVGNYFWTGRFLESKTQRNNFENFESNERLCVVCQSQLREVIIFPCKHLCLCQDCSTKVVNIHKNCPVCRTYIAETLKVYV